MNADADAEDDYRKALRAGRTIYPGLRIGRPGRAATYWVTIALLRVLRLRWKVTINGTEHVSPGAAILVGNHVSALDPVVLVMSTWMRVTAFTKVEVFAKRGAIFFRLMGQIPLRRGDEPATLWAMDMASRCLANSSKLGLYPEGTRSPDRTKLHRLHRRILVPVLLAHPEVPVHAIATRYDSRPWRRIRVTVNISAALDLQLGHMGHDLGHMGHDEVTDIVRDELLRLGGQTYVHVFARDAKSQRSP
ncbi:MAG: 1-acyl-sn-glycerol-3-phosphate acyltransferase [Actinobacteria bacterium]|nr:1-acyl-sn-glycerol-3-phosphate acyltransferase [Actinomycetota bacterium]